MACVNCSYSETDIPLNSSLIILYFIFAKLNLSLIYTFLNFGILQIFTIKNQNHIMQRSYMNFTLYLILILLMYNCTHKNPEQSAEHPEEKVEDEEVFGQILVDNLRMRESAGLNGQEITQIGKNQIVTLTGEKSDHTDAITIRGQLKPHPWYEISFNGDTGWVYGGGIKLLAPEEINETVLNDFLIIPNERVGNVNANATHASLVQNLSEEQVIREKLPLGEGEFVNGTVVFPNSNNELQIFWQNEDFENIRQITIS